MEMQGFTDADVKGEPTLRQLLREYCRSDQFLRSANPMDSLRTKSRKPVRLSAACVKQDFFDDAKTVVRQSLAHG